MDVSMQHLYLKVLRFAEQIENDKEATATRRQFAAHLRFVAAAMQDIEKVDECDKSPGDEDAAIKKVLKPHCVDCATTEGVSLQPCPFDCELFGIKKPYWLCEDCCKSRAADI